METSIPLNPSPDSCCEHDDPPTGNISVTHAGAEIGGKECSKLTVKGDGPTGDRMKTNATVEPLDEATGEGEACRADSASGASSLWDKASGPKKRDAHEEERKSIFKMFDCLQELQRHGIIGPEQLPGSILLSSGPKITSVGDTETIAAGDGDTQQKKDPIEDAAVKSHGFRPTPDGAKFLAKDKNKEVRTEGTQITTGKLDAYGGDLLLLKAILLTNILSIILSIVFKIW